MHQWCNTQRRADAGDLIPVLVTEDSVYHYMDDTDAKMNGVLRAWNAKPELFSKEEVVALNWLLGRWRTFFQTERNKGQWFYARPAKNQTDTYVEELKPFDDMARSRGTTPATPPVTRNDDSKYQPSIFDRVKDSLPSFNSTALLVAAAAFFLLASHR